MKFIGVDLKDTRSRVPLPSLTFALADGGGGVSDVFGPAPLLLPPLPPFLCLLSFLGKSASGASTLSSVASLSGVTSPLCWCNLSPPSSRQYPSDLAFDSRRQL